MPPTQTQSSDAQTQLKTNIQYSAQEVVFGEMRPYWDVKWDSNSSLIPTVCEET